LPLQELSFSDFVAQIKQTQDDYNAAKNKSDVDGMRQALFSARRLLVLMQQPMRTQTVGAPAAQLKMEQPRRAVYGPAFVS
jgi:hypothetical protein